MSNNELLLAISDMMDTKLKPVNARLDKIEMTQENDILSRLGKLEQSQKKIELTLENDVLPRLQTIESCYTSTYTRYQSGVDKIESMQADIDVIKKVVIKHSEKLQRLA
ncbi:MAG: hypothetical protein J1F42_05250 [Lachnospiraceae bacterium]|nr:hypothetical protein [Lachnospiraceae bacterium]